ncbi:MAG: hypothetical protein A2X56_03960 [Nitrospirae bacterium GWC2_57_13]|nr:MAG: hypothetical protein A2X56_03960 [Nitrospirae bacterium GWC2_57_13]OGW43803.1 MAG: hypothetical protein A2X57_00470 [Nitrospirae bacterium GWD2_57_8]
MNGDRRRTILLIALVVGFFIMLTSSRELIAFYADWLFFGETGFSAVFTKTLTARLSTGAALAAVTFLLFFVNVRIANSRNFPRPLINAPWQHSPALQAVDVERAVKKISLGLVVLATLVAFSAGTGFWEAALLYLNSGPAGIVDPIFGKDVSFFLFTLPFIETVNDAFRVLIIMSLILTTLNYLLRGGVSFDGRSVSIDRRVKRHLGIIVALFLLSLALSYALDRYALLTSEHDVLYGASYTDISARLVMLVVMAVTSAVAAVVVVIAAAGRTVTVPLVALAVVAGIAVLGLGVYPQLLQKFKVAPNEIVLERPYIEHHIRFTRYGYGLDNIEIYPYAVSETLSFAGIRRNISTIRNIRLWDEEPLLRTYSQLQQIRTYYRFSDVDNDRYTINGQYMQVMLSPRELSYADLPSKSWINERLVFTHGFGLSMGPVSGITKEGLPEFFIKDIPPLTTAGPKVTRPEIYYGEMPNTYVVVKTKTREFSYPTTEENVYTTYEGSGGVQLSSFARRVLFASHFADLKIVLSSDFTADSRILYYRSIMERVKTIAPFFHYDADPYMVIADNGRLYWIIDAYSYTDRLPYSKPAQRGINYIRNPVKVVVDAYNGSVAFYIVDRDDILTRTYAAVFPTLFRPLADMPQDLRRHIRYPRSLLRIQAQMFAAFHMTDPSIFYNKEDLWEVPSYRDKTMEPYFLIMKLPQKKAEEFILLLPFTPAKRDNLAAWMAARCDGENYGKVIVYTFPRDRLIFGPRQVDARIDQDAYISQQLTLWGQRGSEVIRGSLLIIPIENSLIYVQPLFLVATDRVGLPELRRVIIAHGNDVVMEETLEEAIQRLFSGTLPRAQFVEEAEKVIKRLSAKELGSKALDLLRKAREALRKEDWTGFGKHLKEAEEALKEMGK